MGAGPPFLLPLSFPVWPIKARYFPRRIPVTLRYSKKYPNHSQPFRCPNIAFQYIDLYLSTISRLLVMSVISSSSPNKLRSSNHMTHNTNRHRTLSVQTLRVRELCRHDRGTSLVNNQQRNLDAHIGSYIFYEHLYRSNHITTYVVPFVIVMLLARDSIVRISIPSSISLLASLFTCSIIHHPATNSLVTMLARLIVMCITEWAQRYLSDNRSDKS